jgi:hypothetical protein
MSINKPTKINQLLQKCPSNIVLLSSWLLSQGISYPLQERYMNSNWLTSIGIGAYIRSGDTVNLTGGLYSLQHQAGLDIHIGGLTALSYQNVSHFIQGDKNKTYLYSAQKQDVPAWFSKYFVSYNFEVIKTSFLPAQTSLIDYTVSDYKIKISSKERAILELLYLCPEKESLKLAYQLMELLVNLRPVVLQDLLERCTSIKVKRLFLYMAEKTGHEWAHYLNLSNINLGKGKRTITKGGKLDKKYNIVIEELESI